MFLHHRYIIPLHYHLLLQPNLTTLRFTGSVQIQIDVQNNSNWVVLHSKGLQISKATILGHNFAHLTDQVVVKPVGSLFSCFVSYVNPTISFGYRFFQFFITLPTSRLEFSPPGCSAAARSISCILNLEQNLLRGSMAFIRARIRPVKEKLGNKTAYFYSMYFLYKSFYSSSFILS